MPLIEYRNCYKGFIRVKERRYFVEARVPKPLEWEASDLIIDWRLHSLLNDSLYQFISENCKNIGFPDFFKKLEDFIKASLDVDVKYDAWTQNPLRACELYKNLEKELSAVEDYIKDINLEEGIINIEVVDSALRHHKAVLKITENYPKESLKIVSHDLPLIDANSFHKSVDLNTNTISAFCKRFSQNIDNLQEFWDTVSVLDSNCWVIDPDNPTYKDITRRIKISDRISVVLLFNPYVVSHRPDIKFLGCHSTVSKFRQILQKNLENEVWDPDIDILTNLMNVLETTFPSKPDRTEENSLNLVQVGECAICFEVRLDDEIPSVICDNNNCMSNYHSSCLFKYFSSVPGNRNFFGRIQGECPNCEQGISCPIPNIN